MRSVKSWDCFDTLVARKFIYPKTVFEEVGKKLNINNFVEKRIKAERNSNKTYEDIYRHLDGIDPNVEFEIELDHCYGIVENLNKVKDGDIIVSDMYLSSDQILKILRKCGLEKDVIVYATPDGKSKGYIWKKIIQKVETHTGDNLSADFEIPKKFGITTNYYADAGITKIENYVYKFDQHLACWMRYVRLQCPESGELKKYWQDQTNFNLPILALASLALPDKDIVFNYRDCVYWHPIYEKLTNKKADFIVSSRKVYKNPSQNFINYIKDKTKDKVLVDLQGSGRSVREFFEKINTPQPETIYLCGPVNSPVISLCSSISDSIEKHNCSNLGTLLDWKEGPVYDVCEFDEKIVNVQKKSMEIAALSCKNFNIKNDRNVLQEIMNIIPNNFTTQKIKLNFIDTKKGQMKVIDSKNIIYDKNGNPFMISHENYKKMKENYEKMRSN